MSRIHRLAVPYRARTFALLLILIAAVHLCGQQQIVVLKNADFNENTFNEGNHISVLQGNVEVLFDKYLIKADRATWYHNNNIFNFRSNVHITTENQELTCEELDIYYRKENRLLLRNKVSYYNAQERVALTAQKAEYFINRRSLTLSIDPVLLYFDTAAAETLTIRSREMIYDDSLKIARAYDTVTITKNRLASSSRRAIYDKPKNLVQLRGLPRIRYEDHTVKGDSIDLFFKERTLQGIAVMRNGDGVYKDIARSDTIITKIRGDSLYMQLSDSGAIENIWAHRDASAFHFPIHDSLTMNEAHGKSMRMHFPHGSTTRGSIFITGNARSIYHIAEKNEEGRNEASGDSITVSFDQGKASFLTIKGAVRGSYFARKTK